MTLLPETIDSPIGAPRRLRNGPAVTAALVIACLVALPVAMIFMLAAFGTDGIWPHLIANVIPRALTTTLWLLALVAVLSASMGVISASLITRCDFPGRRILSWALVLPIAVPPYVAAYAFGEFFLFTGPVQTALRAVTGWQSVRDYWFPDIRSTAGVAVVMASVLYPYVYLSTRVVFLMSGRVLDDTARTLGATPLRAYATVMLPVARPAVAAGVILVLMETLNDIGAVQYLGVQTLTYSVYATWLNRGSLSGAAQIACVLLIIVTALIVAERHVRRRQRFHSSRATQIANRPNRTRLTGWRALAATVACTLPVAGGFGIPVYVLGGYALRRMPQLGDADLHTALLTSAGVGLATAVLTVLAALLLLQAVRVARSTLANGAARIATLGYALPGTLLGVGLLFVFAGFDNSLDAFARQYLGFSTGLILSGSGLAIVLACTARFLALAEANIHAGIDKLPHHIDDAARTLGMNAGAAQRKVVLPLLKPAIATALVLVFVDTVKELSATILLRPFGFSTLATQVYEAASRGAVEAGAWAAVLIMAVSLAPVLILSTMLVRDEVA
ncbi:MAG: iron ABC transporter permease [Brucellaceae bacterium]|nr:iron ABC transporter permease [Brucellaceae bacterium]